MTWSGDRGGEGVTLAPVHAVPLTLAPWSYAFPPHPPTPSHSPLLPNSLERADGKHVLLKECHSFDWIMDMIDLVAPDIPEPAGGVGVLTVPGVGAVLGPASVGDAPGVGSGEPPAVGDKKITQVFVNFMSSRVVHAAPAPSGGGVSTVVLGMGCLQFGCTIFKGVRDQTYTISARDLDLSLSKHGVWSLSVSATPVRHSPHGTPPNPHPPSHPTHASYIHVTRTR